MPIKYQPKVRSHSASLAPLQEKSAKSNLPNITLVKMASAEQLTRASVEFYPLRSGGHARIFLAKTANQELIIKKGITKADQADLQKEKQVLFALASSSHVVKLHSNSIESLTEQDTDINQQLHLTDNNSIALEKINGEQINSTFQYLEDALSIGEISIENYFDALVFLFKDMLVGLSDIQQQNFVHGDLKPNNILYDKTKQQAVFIDFGTTVKQGEQLVAGHELYASPEAIGGMAGKQTEAKFSDDLWAMGQIFYEIVNSLLHNKTSKFLTANITELTSYSDRVGQLMALMQTYKQYINQELNQSVLDIYTTEIKDSPISHCITDFASFELFNQKLQPILQCLQGIFMPSIQNRISTADALQLLENDYQIDVEQAKALLAKTNLFITKKAELHRKAREKYNIKFE